MGHRILARRYPLNSYANMWLEVGIVIWPEPHVEIVLINRQHKEIPLSEEAFEKLHDQRGCILRYLSDNNPRYKADVLNLGDVIVKYGTVEERSTICFSVHDTDILMAEDTCRTMLRLYDGVLSKIVELKIALQDVKIQLKAFVGIVRALEDKKQAYEAITSSSKFHKNSQMDNELTALVLDDILKIAQPDYILDYDEWRHPLSTE